MQINSISNFLLKDQINIISQTKQDNFLDVINSVKVLNNPLEEAFGNMKVKINSGTLDISKEKWNRNDFPVWELFNNNAEVDKINKWNPNTLEPKMWDAKLQKNLNTINSGEISITMPDSVYKKMQNDEQYAQKIVDNLKQWKKNYDLKDNAIAASHGANVGMYQMSKSYCISLDEDGTINNYNVISDSIAPNSKGSNNEVNNNNDNIVKSIKYENPEKPEKNIDKTRKIFIDDSLGINEVSYGMSVYATNIIRK